MLEKGRERDGEKESDRKPSHWWHGMFEKMKWGEGGKREREGGMTVPIWH